MIKFKEKWAGRLFAVMSIALCIVGSCAADEGTVIRGLAIKAIPEGLSFLKIAMPKAEIAARINMQTMAVGGGALFQSDIPTSAFYQHSILAFGVDDRLDWIALTGQFPGEHIRHYFDTYLRAVVSEFGSHYRVVSHPLSEAGRRYEAVSLVWTSDSNTVVATLTPLSELTTGKGGQFGLRLMSKQIDWKSILSPAEKPNDRLLQDFKRRLANALDDPMSSPN